MVHHHHGRARARRQAFLFALQVDAPVRSTLARLDSELPLDMIDHFLRAAQHAGNIGAHRYVMAAHRLGLEHGIERRDLVHMNGRQPQIRGHRIHQVGGQESVVLVLNGMQCGNHRGALAVGRELGDPAVDFLADMCRQLHAHRSTSPNTMSWVPITATTSASMCPATISLSAARCANPGARTFSRYGLLAPSDTRYTPNSPFGASTAA